MPAWAWPISVCGTVLIIVVFLAFRFPSQVGDLISRITKVGATGVHAKPPTPVIGQEPTDLAVKSGAAVEEQLKVFDNLFLISREQYFKETLLKDVVTPADREKILLRHLSYVVLVSGFESTYNTIWGSQLSALQSANESGARGVPDETLRAWYEWGKARYPDRYTNYAFEQWMGYMAPLIEASADGQAVRISTFGNEFLTYLVRNRYSFAKEG